jgi:hypothetical protein
MSSISISEETNDPVKSIKIDKAKKGLVKRCEMLNGWTRAKFIPIASLKNLNSFKGLLGLY